MTVRPDTNFSLNPKSIIYFRSFGYDFNYRRSPSEVIWLQLLEDEHKRQQGFRNSIRGATAGRHVQDTGRKHVAVRSPVQQRITGPVKFLRKLLATWKLRNQDAVALLGFDETDADRARDLLAGRADLKGRDVRDRIVCLFQIRKTLHSLLQDDTAENEWLRQPHVGLDQKSPMDLLLEGSMENLLLVKDYVEAIAGL